MCLIETKSENASSAIIEVIISLLKESFLYNEQKKNKRGVCVNKSILISIFVMIISIASVSAVDCTFDAFGCGVGETAILKWIGAGFIPANDDNAHPISLLNTSYNFEVCCDEISSGSYALTYLSDTTAEAHASNDSSVWGAGMDTVQSNAYSCSVKHATLFTHEEIPPACSGSMGLPACSCDTTNLQDCGNKFYDAVGGNCFDLADGGGCGAARGYIYNSYGPGCTGTDVCVFDQSSPTNGHVADCASANGFDWSLCCAPPEDCTNGADDDGDGLFDCADPDCTPVMPAITCTGTPQNSSAYCNGNDCNSSGAYGTGSWCDLNNCSRETLPGFNEFFYCSYGINDTFSPHLPDGHCCQIGEYWNPLTLSCEQFDPCYPNPPYFCDYRYDTEFLNWTGDIDCHDPGAVPASKACCLALRFGNLEYYSDSNNVIIY